MKKFLVGILLKAALTVEGLIKFTNVPAASVDTDKFLVLDGDDLKYRTGEQLLSDIGAGAGGGPGGISMTAAFDATTSWGTANNGIYTLSIAHNFNTYSYSVEVWNDNRVRMNGLVIRANSPNVLTIEVPSTPDGRFAGTIIIGAGTPCEPNPAPVGGGITWNEITGNITASVNNGYITNGVSMLAVTLPATAAIGDVIEVQGSGAGGWRVAQNAGQQILWDAGGTNGFNQTTAGVSGKLESTDRYDSIRLLCITANTTFVVNGAKGNISIT